MRSVVLVLPDLDPLPALLLPDLARARALGDVLQRALLKKRGVVVRFAGPNEGLRDVLSELGRSGVQRVAIAGGSSRARDMARRESREAGIVTLCPGDEPPALRRGVVLPFSAAPFALFPDTALQPPIPCFVERGGAMVRRGVGVCGAMPNWVDEIVFSPPERRHQPNVLHALRVDLERPLAAECEALERLFVARGAECVRLCLDGRTLDEPRVRDRLLELVAAVLPEQHPWLATVCRWHELGIDPLLECWAGNAIAERNRDLIVNIVP